MALLALQDITLAFGAAPLLDQANLVIERGERVCLLGRNGAGKSTVMKLLDGTIRPDRGELVRQTGVSVTRLEQEVPGDVAGTMFDIVADGLGSSGPAMMICVGCHAAAGIDAMHPGHDYVYTQVN